jgi:hypothetical protein
MSSIIEIKSGELYIHGNHIPRHEEKPWLFSASAVHKALEGVIRKKARIKKKDEDTYFHSVRPSHWFVNKLREDGYPEKIANRTRNRIRKFGLAVGFGLHCPRLRTMTYTVEDIEDFEDKDLVYSGIRGNSKKAGTYLCQHAVVDYTAAIDSDFRHELIDLFTQVVNGNVEEVTEKVVENNKKAKGTQTRRENKQLNDEAVAECGKKGILPMKFQEGINIGTLGMTATAYKKLHGIPEPINDNLPVSLVDTKNLALLLGAKELRDDERDSISNAEGREIGITSGLAASLIFEDKEFNAQIKARVAAKVSKLKQDLKEEAAEAKKITAAAKINAKKTTGKNPKRPS